MDVPPVEIFSCPADRGITDEYGEVGTGRRTAYRSFGTSYRANSLLFLDGSVRYVALEPRPKVGPAVVDPVLPAAAAGTDD